MLRISLCCALTFVTQALGEWSWSNPYPFGDTLTSVAFGQGHFVAAGNNVVLTSTNGTDWSEYSTPTVSGTIVSMAYGKRRFAGTTPVDFVSSDNGIQWYYKGKAPGGTDNNVVYGRGRFVSAGQHTVAFSTDGLHWGGYFTGWDTRWSATAYGNGKFVVVGSDGRIIWFSNKTNAHAVRPLGEDLIDIDFHAGKFVALARSNVVYTSTNGEAWIKGTLLYPHAITSLQTARGRLFVGPTGARVTNNKRIEESTFTRPVESLTDWAYGKKRFVGVGDGTVVSSANGTQWSVHSGGPQIHVQDFAANGDVVIAVGGSVVPSPPRGAAGIMWSTTGVWTRVTSVTKHLFAATVFRRNFIAVGQMGTIFKSLDGMNWRPCETTDTNVLRSVVCSPDMAVAVGHGGTILNSPDGVVWSAQQVGTADWTSVAYGDGRFVAMSLSGSCTSEDGVSWTQRPSAGISIDFGNGRFALATTGGNYSDGILSSSTNGIDWEGGVYAPWRVNKIASAPQGILGVAIYGRVDFFGNVRWQFLANWSSIRQYDAVRYLNGQFYVGGEAGHVFKGNPDE